MGWVVEGFTESKIIGQRPERSVLNRYMGMSIPG